MARGGTASTPIEAWPCVVCRYEMMQLCRQFENACNQAYMQGSIRGFMHLDNGQEVCARRVRHSVRRRSCVRQIGGTRESILRGEQIR